MFIAEKLSNNRWRVVETDGVGNKIGVQKVAVRAEGSGDDAITTVLRSRLPLSADQIAEQAGVEHTVAVKLECSRRIYAIFDAPTLSNIQGAAIAGELSESQMVMFRVGRKWVKTMLDTSREMAINREANYRADAAWPPVPDGIADLVSAY